MEQIGLKILPLGTCQQFLLSHLKEVIKQRCPTLNKRFATNVATEA